MAGDIPFMTDAERRFVEAISGLGVSNPFLPERLEWERQALGSRHCHPGSVWSSGSDQKAAAANLEALRQDVEDVADRLRGRLAAGSRGGADELALYEDLVNYLVYYRFESLLYRIVEPESPDAGKPEAAALYRRFCTDLDFFLEPLPAARHLDAAGRTHLFACFFQIRRAFHYIFRFVVGESMATARLRAAIWQSVFTCDMRRYRRSLYNRLGEVATLITGPSGSGKELVARAIGYARYIPYDTRTGNFLVDWRDTFHALNLSALSPTLIESELFGHRKGAYTGAADDHAGWLETCGFHGSVFLDEIGEVAWDIQVKLLRVLEARSFSRLGETAARNFQGKLIAATNRDLGEEMSQGRFRRDLYYRLCSDIVETPSLQERIADCPEELCTLTAFLSRRVAGDTEAPVLARQALAWIGRNLGETYSWPGNVRELEQCVRNILIRGSYRPSGSAPADGDFLTRARQGELSADELLSRYCRLVYERHGTYEGAGRVLGLDRRTVKSRIEALTET